MNKINNITLNFIDTLIQHELFRVEIYRSGDIGDKNPAQSWWQYDDNDTHSGYNARFHYAWHHFLSRLCKNGQ